MLMCGDIFIFRKLAEKGTEQEPSYSRVCFEPTPVSANLPLSAFWGTSLLTGVPPKYTRECWVRRK